MACPRSTRPRRKIENMASVNSSSRVYSTRTRSLAAEVVGPIGDGSPGASHSTRRGTPEGSMESARFRAWENRSRDRGGLETQSPPNVVGGEAAETKDRPRSGFPCQASLIPQATPSKTRITRQSRVRPATVSREPRRLFLERKKRQPRRRFHEPERIWEFGSERNDGFDLRNLFSETSFDADFERDG